MEVVYKALTRPAMIFGVPITPFFLACATIALLGLYINLLILSLIVPVVFIMKEISKKDDFIFRLIFLKMSFLTNPLSKKFFSNQKTYITASKYSHQNLKFDIPKLSIISLDKVPNIDKYLPYQTLINDIVITKNYDLIGTWRIDGITFEVENDDFIEFNKQKINMLLRQFDNKLVSFYIHSVRVSIEDKLNSKFNNEFLSEIDKKYYDGFGKNDLKENRFYLTVIYSPFSTKALRSSFSKDSVEKRIKQLNNFIKTFETFAITIETNLKDVLFQYKISFMHRSQTYCS